MLSKSTTKMPEWFPSMIEKVLDDTGNSIFKQIDEDAVLITNKEMPGIEITKYDNGRLEVLGKIIMELSIILNMTLQNI